jgi:hypothetical protein
MRWCGTVKGLPYGEYGQSGGHFPLAAAVEEAAREGYGVRTWARGECGELLLERRRWILGRFPAHEFSFGRAARGAAHGDPTLAIQREPAARSRRKERADGGEDFGPRCAARKRNRSERPVLGIGGDGLGGHGGVVRGGVDAPVPLHDLDLAKVGAVFQQMSGEGVAE